MINLIGCNKENFFRLLELMEYKPKKTEEKKEHFFVYKPKQIRKERLKKNKKFSKDNPFVKLSTLRFR